ncbi:MAG: site-specific integrase [Prevotellaceae bacterium]|jgi:site-specific recombinase XerD|nr:site-specific integrase [Prevotellaceae bacterium]
MRKTFRILFYLKRDKKKANGTVPLFCRITVDGKEVRFGMKKDINPKYWDAKAGKATGRTNEAVELNALIDNTKSAIYKICRDLQEKENNVTAETVKNTFLGLEIKHQNLLELFDRHNNERKLLIGKSISEATCDKYRIIRNHLADFIKIRYNLSDIPLKDINHKFVCDFEIFMLTSRGCIENTAARYMQFFKHIIIIATKLGWIDKSPFSEYRIQIRKTDRGYLTQDEVEILMNRTFDTKRLERVRDVFVFCCFTGLSYIDVKTLTSDNICTSFDGKLWITGKRGKTGESYNVPLLDIPKVILEKYRNTLPDNRLLPVINNQNSNAYLKEIGELCGIKKKLTFHLSRHTFATLTLSKGVSIESVSKMLGHTNIQTTQIYARITDEKIGNDMAVFAGKIRGMETKLSVTNK